MDGSTTEVRDNFSGGLTSYKEKREKKVALQRARKDCSQLTLRDIARRLRVDWFVYHLLCHLAWDQVKIQEGYRSLVHTCLQQLIRLLREYVFVRFWFCDEWDWSLIEACVYHKMRLVLDHDNRRKIQSLHLNSNGIIHIHVLIVVRLGYIHHWYWELSHCA